MPERVAWVLAWGFVFVAAVCCAFVLWGGPLTAWWNSRAAEREALNASLWNDGYSSGRAGLPCQLGASRMWRDGWKAGQQKREDAKEAA